MILASPDLKCPRTVQYEVGVDRNLFRMGWLQVTGWNKKQDSGLSSGYLFYLNDDGESVGKFTRQNSLYRQMYGASIRTEWNTRFFSGYFYHERTFEATEYLAQDVVDLRPNRIHDRMGACPRGIQITPAVAHQLGTQREDAPRLPDRGGYLPSLRLRGR